MNRIKTFLFAIVVMMGATGIMTACQEDAPVINYTMTVSVTNDFSKVVEAIENGFLKNEDAVNRLSEAIDKMNRDQAGKLQAVIDVLNAVNATLDTKLAAIEAAMQAQTLSLEGKLELIRAAIEALPDYSAKLEAITSAIEALPDYSDKLAALETAMQAQTLSLEGKLELIKAAIEAFPDYTTQLEAITSAIEALPDYSDKLAAIEAALEAQTFSLEGKLALIEAALKAGFTDQKTALGGIRTALEALKTSMGDFSSDIDAIVNAIDGIADALDDTNFVLYYYVSDALYDIFNAIDGLTDYSEILDAIKTSIVAMLEEIKEAIANGGPSTDYVDLGLPSGVKWATKNLGASKPSDYGDHYAWGETEPKAVYSWSTYKWMQTGYSDENHITKYTVVDGKTNGIWYDGSGNFIGDAKVTLDAADDAATVKLGSPWRMPTFEEAKELLDNCTWTWTTLDGIDGCEVKGPNGNSIFLPAAGRRYDSNHTFVNSWANYWTGSLKGDFSTTGYYFHFDSVNHEWAALWRYYGFSIRPVRP
ncbi:MAG: hypothetical protein II858_02320 [Bacteroidales bacterium]|nr:hypothetical protein [Bacteroidales bacterium]